MSIAQKLFGAALIVASSASLGVFKARSLKKRADSLGGFIRAVRFLQGEVAFTKSGMRSAFIRAAAAGILPEFFTSAAELLTERGMEYAWRAALDANVRELALSEEDAELIASIGASLGRTGSENELRSLEHAARMIEERYRQAAALWSRDCALYRSAGAILGAAAAIILF